MIATLLSALLLQTAAPACTATVPPPAGLEAWSGAVRIPSETVPVGSPIGVSLKPSDQVKFVLAPERAPAAGTNSAVVHFSITVAGTYRIALSGGAWIDVVRGGKSLTSVAHTEGLACSGIRKIVDFTLAPGRYVLQLSGAKDAPMRVLIAPK